MNKRITSILLCFVMLFSMLVSAVPAYAAPANPPMVFIEADRTEANPGDTITYKFYIQQPDTMTAFAFNMVAPNGLTYVEDSGTLGSTASAAWGSTFEWVPEADLQLQWYSSSGDDVTDTSKIELITIQFKVADDATIGAEYELSLTNMQLAAGSTQNYDDISATVEVSPAKVKIVAKPVAVTGITIDETLAVTVGKTATPGWTVNPPEATNKTVSFKSDNTAVATVNETTGVVTGVKEGKATITVTTADGNFTDTCEVSVTEKPNPPAYDAPANVAATYGQTLSEIALVNPVGNTAGTWAWDTPATPVGDVGTRSFKATFTPTSDDYATVTGIDVEVTVNPKAINDVAIAAIPDQQYTGNQLTPAVTVTGDGGKTLELNRDYEVAYGANVNVAPDGGSVTVSAKAGGNYTFGDVNKTFNIVAQAGQVTISGNLNVKFGAAVPDVTIDKHGSDGAVTVYYYTNEACTAGQTAVKPTAVGSYWAKAKMDAGSNHGSAESNVIGFAISRADITPTVDITGWTFGETADDPSVTGNTGNGNVTYLYKIKDADDNTYAAVVPVNAGNYTVKAKIDETANYNAASATKDFTIAPKDISDASIAAVDDQTYTSSEIKPEPAVTLGSALVKGTDFDYVYESNTYVGNAAIKAVGKGNYTGTATGSFNIVAAEQTPAITAAASVTKGGKTLDLKPMVTGAMGEVSFTINGAANGCSISDGILTSSDNTGEVKINVAVSAKDVNGDQVNEYNAYSANDAITVTINDKEAQDALNITSDTTVTYGQTLNLTSAGGSGSGAVTYAVTDGTGKATVNGNVLTPVQAGTVTVTVTKEADDTYNAISSTPVEITIAQAPLTVTAKSYTINVNGTVPDLSQGTHYTVTGLAGSDVLGGTIAVKYQQNGQDATPDKTKAGTYDIVISGAEAPNANYADPVHVNGTLKIQQAVVGGGGGGYYGPTVQKPIIEAGEGVKVTLSADGKIATIEAEAGYELDTVVLNGTDKGIVKEVKGLKTGDKLVITAKKIVTEPDHSAIIAALDDYKLAARSKMVTMKNGKKAVKITWYDEDGRELDFDGVEIFRSVKRYKGYGTKSFFETEKDQYYNTLIKKGTKYFYKVRGYVEIDGEKYYTQWSKKAWRTVK